MTDDERNWPTAERVSYLRMTLLAAPLLLAGHLGSHVVAARTAVPVRDLMLAVVTPTVIVAVWLLAIRWRALQRPDRR